MGFTDRLSICCQLGRSPHCFWIWPTRPPTAAHVRSVFHHRCASSTRPPHAKPVALEKDAVSVSHKNKGPNKPVTELEERVPKVKGQKYVSAVKKQQVSAKVFRNLQKTSAADQLLTALPVVEKDSEEERTNLSIIFPDAKIKSDDLPQSDEQQSISEDKPRKKKKRKPQKEKNADKELASSRTPWIRPEGYAHLQGTTVLDAEIRDFVTFIAPSPNIEHLRSTLVTTYEQRVKSVLGSKATLHCFGSSATGLYLPWSDIDLVIHDTKSPHTDSTSTATLSTSALKKSPSWLHATRRLQLLRQNLKRTRPTLHNPHTHLLLIPARVPIIKLADARTGLQLDISYGASNGRLAVEYINSIDPVVRHMVFVLKLFLKNRGLNETTAGGGGGYGLVLWVEAFVKLRGRLCPWRKEGVTLGEEKAQEVADGLRPKTVGRRKPWRPHPPTIQHKSPPPPQSTLQTTNLATLLLDFLHYFGTHFKPHRHGLSPLGPGTLLHRPKSTKSDTPTFLIQDPLDTTNNVTKGAHAFDEIQSHFRKAYTVLSRLERGGRVAGGKGGAGESILGTILWLEKSQLRHKRHVERVAELAHFGSFLSIREFWDARKDNR
ncbi:Non-canonical poly(A) RNA polymerase papd5 [Rhizophlyctis rosea]|nr:Non-canonical poly(A) RNA polymerase papd5 [Rhizophlyctis rosea]